MPQRGQRRIMGSTAAMIVSSSCAPRYNRRVYNSGEPAMRTRDVAVQAVVLGCVATGGTAQGFCGFFVSGNDSKLTNNASQVALLLKGNRTVMTMAHNYQGPPEDFAMV